MSNNRTLFSKQPARIMLIDVTSLDATTCHNICLCLQEFFSLICSLGGPCRVPFFGLFALGNFPDALFPLQHVIGNFSRIQTALEEVKNFHREQAYSAHSKQESSVIQGLHEATTMFRRQAQSLLQSVGYWAQLEICVFTGENVATISKAIERATKEISNENLKKVQVVSLNNPERLMLVDDMMIEASQGSNQSSVSSSDLTGMVDFQTIDHDMLSIHSYLRNWLHDSATDREHLHIVLPSQDHPVVLKCDLQERILSPALLPCHSQFNLHPEVYVSKSLPTTNLRNGISVPLYKLKTIKRIPVNAICESVLYGMPLVVRATSCWKVDWDELETNQHHFQALCLRLNNKNEALLVSLIDDNPTPTTSKTTRTSFQYKPRAPVASGHFLLLPSHSDTLLLKAVAVNELLLPCQLNNVEQVEEQSKQVINEALDGIPSKDSYNPLNESSDLYPSLTSFLTKNVSVPAAKRSKLSRASNQANKSDTGRVHTMNKPSMERGEVWGIAQPIPKPPPQVYNLDDAFPTEL